MQASDFQSEFLTTKGAISYLGIPDATFYRRKKDGVIPAPVLIYGRPFYRFAELKLVKEAGILVLKRGRKKQ